MPLAASAQLIENGIDDLTQVGGFWGTAGRQNDQGSDECPLGIAQVGCVGFASDHNETLPILEKTSKNNSPKTPKLPRLLLQMSLSW